ncbi:MAG: tetratricopeptide repeat protein, partial [Janthinobacterium lividum]
RAREMLQKAMAAQPNNGAIVDSLGWALLRSGDVPGAVRWLERAVELEPVDATLNGHLGDAYWAAGRHGEAMDQWRHALTLAPEPDERARIEARLHAGNAPGRVPAGPTHALPAAIHAEAGTPPPAAGPGDVTKPPPRDATATPPHQAP